MGSRQKNCKNFLLCVKFGGGGLHSGIFCLMDCEHKANSKGAANVKFSTLLTKLCNKAATMTCIVAFLFHPGGHQNLVCEPQKRFFWRLITVKNCMFFGHLDFLYLKAL